jgi:hypothetical protein
MFNALELKVPPLALVAVFGAVMWLASASSAFTLSLPWRAAFALIFLTVGLAIVLAGALAFRRAKTTVNPLTPKATTAMVTSGIYRFTRNPMYLGFLLVLAGWAMYLSNLLAFALLPLFPLYLNRFKSYLRKEPCAPNSRMNVRCTRVLFAGGYDRGAWRAGPFSNVGMQPTTGHPNRLTAVLPDGPERVSATAKVFMQLVERWGL